MTSAKTSADDQAQIKARIDAWIDAAHKGDIDAFRDIYEPDVRAFDAIGPLQFEGADAYLKHWEACVAPMQGPMLFEAHDLDIAAHGDVAFASFLARCGGTGPDGEEHVGWTRATICFRKTGGSWRVTHEHFSVPCDPESGKAFFDLEPEKPTRANAA